MGTAAGVVLGAVLLLSGSLKLRDPRWPAAAAALGAPAPSIPLVAPAEIGIGALTAAGVARPWPAVAALALLVAFTVVLGRALLSGAHPICACFGAVSARPIGPASIVRNVVLVAIAVLAVAA